MKKIIALALVAIVAVSCGKQEQDKRKELEKLRQEYSDLGKKIEQLEKEVATADTGKKVLSPARVMEIQKMMFKNPVEIQGIVESDKNVMVSSEVMGRILELPVKEGQRVSQGQLLMRINGDVTANTIREVENALNLAEITYQKQKRLREQNVGTEMQLLQAENQRDALKKQLETLRTQYAKYNVTAPVDGEVELVNVKLGESIAPGMPLVQVVNNSNLKVKADISEKYVKAVKTGDSVIVKFPTISEEFGAKASAVGQVINPNNRTFSLTVNLTKKTDGIKPNLLALVTFYDYVNPKAIAVPSNIIISEMTDKYVYVAEEKGKTAIVKKVKVKTGNTAGAYTEIIDGLKEGDKVITENIKNLVPGDEINILK